MFTLKSEYVLSMNEYLLNSFLTIGSKILFYDDIWIVFILLTFGFNITLEWMNAYIFIVSNC